MELVQNPKYVETASNMNTNQSSFKGINAMQDYEKKM
jgi:hypothetical protein